MRVSTTLLLLSALIWASPAAPAAERPPASLPAACEVLASPTPEAWAKLRAELGRRARQGLSSALTLSMPAESIESLGAPLGEGDSGFVFEARGRDGSPLAVKLVRNVEGRSLKELAVSLQIHLVLGELGLAPRLRGVVLRARVPELLAKIPKPPKGEDFSAALVSDAIAGATLLKPDEPETGVYDWDLSGLDASGWNIPAMIRRIEEVEATLPRLGIEAVDLQFLVTRDGQLFLIDFDMFKWISEKDEVYDYQYHGKIQRRRASLGGIETLASLKSALKRKARK